MSEKSYTVPKDNPAKSYMASASFSGAVPYFGLGAYLR